MHPGERLSFLVFILAPAVILISLNAYPASIGLRSGIESANVARSNARYQEEADNLRQVLAREPWRVWLWEQIGFAEVKAARFPQAVEAFLYAEAADALSLDGLYQLGEVFLQQDAREAAEETWRKLLQRGENIPGDVAAKTYERLAQLQRSRGDFSAAVDTLRAWKTTDPNNARAAFLLGLHLTVLSPDEAVRLLVDASSQDPFFTPTVQIIRRGISAAGESDDLAYGWVMIGRALGSAGQWDFAIEAFQQAVEASPQYAEAWAFLGEARHQIGQNGKIDLDRAAALDPESVVVRALMAMHYRREGNYDRALENLQAIAVREPEEPMWEVELGNTRAEEGNLPVALEHFQKAVHLAPDLSIYWQYLARFCVTYNMSIQAVGLPAARQAVILSPNDPGALDLMGWTMVTLQDYASAERFLQQAVKKDASHKQALLHLGQLYLQQQEPGRAYPYLKKALLLGGDDPAGAVARRLLLQYYGEEN